MFNVIKAWFFKYFSDPEAAILLLAIAISSLFIWIFGSILFPLFAGLILSYLLDSIVMSLQKRFRLSRGIGITIVFTLFIGLFAYVLLGLAPTFYKQIIQFSTQLPFFLDEFHTFLNTLPDHYPGLISNNTAQTWIASTNFDLKAFASLGKSVISESVSSLPQVFGMLVYIFLVPLITFFILKDKRRLLKDFTQYMPDQRGLILEVAREMRVLMGRYVRGKVFEVLLVGLTTWIVFRIFHLDYAFLLAALVGLSAIIPYVGAIVVTIPVLAAALLQFGTTPPLFYTLIAYGLIQILDGNLLVPILYAEAVNLNPVVIITAVLFFGGIWGFWGLFFAIPLATLVKAVVNAWIRHANLTYEDKLARRAQQELPL